MERLLKKLNKLSFQVHNSIIVHVIERNVKRYANARMGKAFRKPLGIFDKAHPVGTSHTEATLKYLWKLLLEVNVKRRNATDYDPKINVKEIEEEKVNTFTTGGSVDEFTKLIWQQCYEAGLEADVSDNQDDRGDVELGKYIASSSKKSHRLTSKPPRRNRRLISIARSTRSRPHPSPSPKLPRHPLLTRRISSARTSVSAPTQTSVIAPPISNQTRVGSAVSISRGSLKIQNSTPISRRNTND